VHQDDDVFDRERSMGDCRNGLCRATRLDHSSANDRVDKKESRKKNSQALFHIQIALDKSMFPRILRILEFEDARR
jgi:hypothetical protein